MSLSQLKLRGRFAGAICVVFFSFISLSSKPASAWDIKWADLVNYLNNNGDPIPRGAGIRAALVEAGGSYLPSGKPTNNVSNLSAGTSTHATGVANQWYQGSGKTQLVDLIDSYSANNFLAKIDSHPPATQAVSVLRTASDELPLVFEYSGPEGGLIQVANHSWVGTFGNDAVDINAMRRLDYHIERDNTFHSAGASDIDANYLLSNSYNSVTITRVQSGPTGLDVPGRSKPDLVILNENFASNAAPVGAGAASTIISAAINHGVGDLQATNVETVKAILMAGADKAVGWTKTFNGSYFEPLDRNEGAGYLNIFNSYLILEGGQHEGHSGISPINNANTYGWDFDDLNQGQQKLYYFEIGAGDTADEVSILSTWHRRVTPDQAIVDILGLQTCVGGPCTFSTSLADMNLRLWEADAAGNLLLLLDESVSPIDNVEHLYATALPAGRYAIQLAYEGTDLGNWDYAIAWRSENFQPAVQLAIPEPSSAVMMLLAMLIFLRRKTRHSGRCC